MRLLITLVVVAVLSWALVRPLCSHSMLFYLAAVALAGAGAYLTIAPPAVLPLREVAFVVQKGYVAFALFAVVMMMGVLDKRSAVRRRLQPVRAQLSLLGTILIAGHIGFYAVVYLEILGRGRRAGGDAGAPVLGARTRADTDRTASGRAGSGQPGRCAIRAANRSGNARTRRQSVCAERHLRGARQAEAAGPLFSLVRKPKVARRRRPIEAPRPTPHSPCSRKRAGLRAPPAGRSARCGRRR